MSYIRSGSNPEGLYILGSAEAIEFYWNDSRGSHQEAFCSHSDWNGFWKLFLEDEYLDPERNEDEPSISFGDLSVREVPYDFDQHIVLPEYPMPTAANPDAWKKRNIGFQVELKVGDKSIFMWRTTWQYLYENALQEGRWANAERGTEYTCACQLPFSAKASETAEKVVQLRYGDGSVKDVSADEAREIALHTDAFARVLRAVALSADYDKIEEQS